MPEDYEKITVRFSKEETAQMARLRVAGGYGSRGAVIHEAVRELLDEHLKGTDTIYVPGVNMGGSIHKGTGKAEQ